MLYWVEILSTHFYHRYIFAVVESSWLDLVMLNYKNLTLYNIVYPRKSWNPPQNGPISPILIKIFNKLHHSNWLIYKLTTYKNFIRTGQTLIKLFVYLFFKKHILRKLLLKLKTEKKNPNKDISFCTFLKAKHFSVLNI